jgi:hypothetical protein
VTARPSRQLYEKFRTLSAQCKICKFYLFVKWNNIYVMPRKFTANGTFIPQDAADNDMCILFMKYGCCRFKTKCKKSHWVPPLPGILMVE